MNDLYVSVISTHDKNVWRAFLFAIWFFYAASVELSKAHLSKKTKRFIIFSSQNICKTKNFSRHLLY